MSTLNLNPASLDTTHDVATLLRLGTQEDHEKAQHWFGARLLTGVGGRLTKESYIRYLIILWHVYATLENALDTHCSDPIIFPTYNPRLLSRQASLSADIAYFLQTSESEWKDHPFASSFMRKLPSEAMEYTACLQSASLSPPKLLAHAYVRYLGDLSGGQIIKRNIRKVFELSDDDISGVQMYQFEKLEGGGHATIGDIRTIKTWYRDGLNNSIGDDLPKKAILVEEARHVYRLNRGILSLLQEAEIQEKPSFPSLRKLCPALSLSRLLLLVLLVIGGLHAAKQRKNRTAFEG